MTKLTSKDCVAAILHQLKQQVPSWSNVSNRDIKRVSKRLLSTGDIQRVFMIQQYPMSATVVESSGAIQSLQIDPIMLWQESKFQHITSSVRDDDGWHSLRETPEFEQLVRASITTAHYGFCPSWDDELGWTAVITPLEYFRTTQCLWDEHLSEELKWITGDEFYEATESVFELPNCNSGEDIIRYMGGLGFAVDTEFINRINESMEASS